MVDSRVLPPELIHGLNVSDVEQVAGGAIARAYRVRSSGRSFFVKTLPDAPANFFAREVAGLRAMRASGSVSVPLVVRQSSNGLVLEWIPTEPGFTGTAASAEQFGRELADLHSTTAATFGSVDHEPVGFLGSVELDLQPEATWAASYLERRVIPLTRSAVQRQLLKPEANTLAERLLTQGEERWGPMEQASLVHGDLWSGNRVVCRHDRHWLVDPSAHYGHREFDLALMRLFGGFEERVFSAYDEVRPLAPGWRARLDLHQLVPLLVHTLMFGSSYSAQTMGCLARVTR